MKLCIAGKNNIAVDCLYFVINLLNKNDICVILNKDDTYKNTWQKSLGFYANLENIQKVTLEDVEKLEDIVFLSLEFDRIIKPSNFKSNKLYNIHFSLLPEYKGMYTSIFPIIHGKNYSGVTLHRIDSGIDTGDIIAQIKFDITGYNSAQLYNCYLKKGTELVCKNLNKLLLNKIDAKKQDTHHSTYFSKRSFDFSKKEIDVRQTAYQIKQFVNAMSFRVYQLPLFQGYEIYKAEITKQKSNNKPGVVVINTDEFLEVETIDYNIILYKDYYNEMIECCKTNDINKAKKIINYIPDKNEIDRHGWRLLFIACYHDADKIVRLLLDHGANCHLTNLNGTTALMYAKDGFLRNKNFKILDLLINRGIDIKAKDINGKSVLDYTTDKTLLDYFYDKIS